MHRENVETELGSIEQHSERTILLLPEFAVRGRLRTGTSVQRWQAVAENCT